MNKIQKIIMSKITQPWKWLVDLWGYITILIFIIDFIAPSASRIQSTGAAIIYTAILVIYTSNKEFHRWRNGAFLSRYHGEFFIFLWTILLLFFVILAGLWPDKFSVMSVFFNTYITVLGIFAVTLNSKKLKKKNNKKS